MGVCIAAVATVVAVAAFVTNLHSRVRFCNCKGLQRGLEGPETGMISCRTCQIDIVLGKSFLKCEYSNLLYFSFFFCVETLKMKKRKKVKAITEGRKSTKINIKTIRNSWNRT